MFHLAACRESEKSGIAGLYAAALISCFLFDNLAIANAEIVHTHHTTQNTTHVDDMLLFARADSRSTNACGGLLLHSLRL